MSVTAVPLRPVAKGSLTKLWIGVALLVAAAFALAWVGERGLAGSASSFMAENADADGVITTPSGLQYKVVKPGAGPSPTTADVAYIAYRGALTNGEVFDENPQAAMPLEGVIPGFVEGLQLMQRGGEYKLWIPPQLGYGDKEVGEGRIPANSVLVFDVKLMDFKSKAELMRIQQEMQRMQMEGGPAH